MDIKLEKIDAYALEKGKTYIIKIKRDALTREEVKKINFVLAQLGINGVIVALPDVNDLQIAEKKDG